MFVTRYIENHIRSSLLWCTRDTPTVLLKPCIEREKCKKRVDVKESGYLTYHYHYHHYHHQHHQVILFCFRVIFLYHTGSFAVSI